MRPTPLSVDMLSLGPFQLADRLGLSRHEFERLLACGLIPGPDQPQARWSQAVVQRLAGRFRPRAIQDRPDLASPADVLITAHLCRPVREEVPPSTMDELRYRKLL